MQHPPTLPTPLEIKRIEEALDHYESGGYTAPQFIERVLRIMTEEVILHATATDSAKGQDSGPD